MMDTRIIDALDDLSRATGLISLIQLAVAQEPTVEAYAISEGCASINDFIKAAESKLYAVKDGKDKAA